MKRIIVTVVFGLLLFITPLSHAAKTMSAHVAGSWYPAQHKELADFLQALKTQASAEFNMTANPDKIRALIVPHAGYKYSGTVAAAAFRLVASKHVDKVIILGPSHFVPFYGVALPSFNSYTIPTGTLGVDRKAVNALKKNSLFKENSAAFNPEHSVEAELPFIQFYLPETPIVPLVVGSLSKQDTEKVAQHLKKIITPSTLIVISTDFIHYGPQFDYTPFTDHALLHAQQLDSRMLVAIQQNNVNGFREIIQETGATVCGRIPVEILLNLVDLDAFGPTITRLVAYATSVDVSKDEENFVTYASLVITNEIDNTALNMQEKNSLVRYARQVLEQAFQKNIDISLFAPPLTAQLMEPKGVFVTLYSMNNGRKELRGCIGTILPQKPLYEAVADSVLASAFHDPRFAPVTQEELDTIVLEVSILTLPHPIASYKDIVLNKHGIILSNGAASALFLPKVPQEFGFTLEQTLDELSKKAGLPAKAWRSPDTKFQVFESLDFGEKGLDILNKQSM